MAVNPADGAVLGAVYGSDAMRAILDERGALARMLEVEAALARAQARLGLIPAAAAEAISAAADVDRLDMAALAAATRNMGFPTVGLVKQLSALAGPEAGRWTHYGATTQDILDTALVLQLRAALDLMGADLDRLIAALAALARAHRGTVMAGRTHAQQALPITFGYKVALWLDPLITMRERLVQLRPRVLRLQFGGAVGTLASLGTDGPRVAAELAGELALPLPAIPWHVARDGIAELGCWCGLLGGALAKPASDILWLMQSEVGEASEPAAPGKGGSSTMPQKRNPIGCEYVIVQARGAQALVPQLLGAMLHEHERGAGAMQLEQLALGQALLLTHGALATLIPIAEGLVVDAARMRRNLDAGGGLIMSEAVMMGLAPHLGRGVAHDVVHHACEAAIAQGLHLRDALAREPRVTAVLDAAGIARLTDLAGYLGSAKAFTDAVLARL
ncbi:class-II fumarase/aspartase family protein [Falsiroseomonas oryziterrae]|uniref:class-II fumarase/aspartase family protein n=1 Tax=Falsiroseomonas oryziterrae TaxID=2911368 RepID=UPI001F1BA568|nr:adenylosuccinate lyase family protein [Roseomonas sp. NPKOSM-4]